MVQETRTSLIAEKINELLNDLPPEAWTVGYGERFQHPDEDEGVQFRLVNNNTPNKISHETNEGGV